LFDCVDVTSNQSPHRSQPLYHGPLVCRNIVSRRVANSARRHRFRSPTSTCACCNQWRIVRPRWVLGLQRFEEFWGSGSGSVELIVRLSNIYIYIHLYSPNVYSVLYSLLLGKCVFQLQIVREYLASGYRGSASGPRWRTFVLRTPLCPPYLHQTVAAPLFAGRFSCIHCS